MSGSNGNVPAVGVNAPIIGQPFTLFGWTPTVLITCNCEAKYPLMIVGAKAIVKCPKCERCYQIKSLAFDAASNGLQIELNIGVVGPRPQASSPFAQ